MNSLYTRLKFKSECIQAQEQSKDGKLIAIDFKVFLSIYLYE